MGPAAVTPTNRFWLGIEENGDFPVRQMASALNVVNPSVDLGNGSQFLTQRARVAACSTGEFLEMGWIEAGWRGDAQYVYTYDSINDRWNFYDQYSISSGSRFYFQIFHAGNGDWAADIFWDGGWHRLSTVNLGNHWGCISTAHVEISTAGTNRQFPFPPIKYGDGSHTFFSMGLAEAMSGNQRVWDTSIPTQENVTSEAGYYTTSFQNRYSNFTVESHNRAPSASVSVTPGSGNRATNFSANMSAFDPDGDEIFTRQIHWGDGSVSWGASGTHRYQSAGSYTVKGFACDMWNECTWSAGQSVNVAFSNTAPGASIQVSPRQGDLTTTFSATLEAWDNEGDPLSYEIDWGDGTIEQSMTSSHRYAAPGEYLVEGTVTDSHGSITTDYTTVAVCAVVSLQCNPPPSPPDACTNGGLCPDRPAEWEDLEPIKAPLPADAPNLGVTELNRALVVTVNAGMLGDRSAMEPQSVGQRQENLVQRLKRLASQSRANDKDSTGAMPDIILLQEVHRVHAEAIAQKLSSSQGFHTNFNVAIAMTDEEGQDAEDHYVDANTAIIFNRSTMVKLDTTKITLRYNRDDADNPCPSQGSLTNEQFLALTDLDGNGNPDCGKPTYTKAALGLFAEHRPGSTQPRGLGIAVASTHLVTKGHFADQAGEERKYDDWAKRLAVGVKTEFQKLDAGDMDGRARVIGGDFNVHRCEQKDRDSNAFDEPGDYPGGGSCVDRQWWTSLSDGTSNFAPFADAVWLRHKDNPNSRLLPQYRDGCDVWSHSTGSCDRPQEKRRRIDFLFGQGSAIKGASHDLFCGQFSGQGTGVRRTCDDPNNNQHYSDHRLVWMLIGDGQ